MIKSTSIYTASLMALVIAFAMAAFFVKPAAAQTASKLKCNGCVKSKQIKNNGIKSTDIKNGQVKNADLGNDAVTSAKVSDDSLTALDLSNEAGADFISGDIFAFLLGTPTVVSTVTLTAPGPGIAIVHASGYFNFNGNPGGARCSITQGTAVDFTHLIISESDFMPIPNIVISGIDSWGAVRAFELKAAGNFIVNLVCEAFSAEPTVEDVSMVISYVPTRY